jgi:hypothetical protein
MCRPRRNPRPLPARAAAACSLLLLGGGFAPAYDVHFDYTSFDNPGTPGASPHFGPAQFAVLNYPSLNGNYMMTSTDSHRPEMVANGNALAEFYNTLTTTYTNQAIKDGAAAADTIDAYTVKNSTHNGARPDWLILNEISSSLWQNTTSTGDTYRRWLVDCVTRLHDDYHYNVVTYAPFPNPGLRDATWQALSAKSYIGIESYLSGAEVMASGSDDAERLAFCEAAYRSSKASYMARGIPESQLFLGEFFGNTAAGVGYGRAGISASDWDKVIQLRQDAIRAVGFAGFLAYAWGSNPMHITEAEQVQHEYYYRSRLVLPNQQPQWLSDDAPNVNGTILPLSWGKPLNWIGGVPDGSGAVANFYRTNTAPRTITLDGPRTVGTLTVDSANSYTIVPGGGGGGGTLALANGGRGALVGVASGAHTVAVPVTVGDALIFDIPGGALTLSSDLSNPDGRSITKTGAGTLTIAGPQNHGPGATLIASGGTTNLDSNGGAHLGIIANATVRFGASQTIASLVVSAGNTATLTPGGAKVLSTATLAVNGKLDLVDNALIVRAGGIGGAGGDAAESWDGAAYTGVGGLVASGRDGGTWDGNGIVTSAAAAAGTGDYTTIGVASAADILGIAPSDTSTWHGQTVTGASALAMYTYGGDANLDGIINIDDYGRIDANVGFNGSVHGWYNGDFNDDGKINIDDYGIIDSNIGIQGPPLGAAQPLTGFANATAVPEPGEIGILTVSFLTAACPRRKKSTRHRRSSAVA